MPLDQNAVPDAGDDPGDAAARNAPRLSAAMRPSTWTSMWAAIALVYLMFARRFFRKLG